MKVLKYKKYIWWSQALKNCTIGNQTYNNSLSKKTKNLKKLLLWFVFWKKIQT